MAEEAFTVRAEATKIGHIKMFIVAGFFTVAMIYFLFAAPEYILRYHRDGWASISALMLVYVSFWYMGRMGLLNKSSVVFMGTIGRMTVQDDKEFGTIPAFTYRDPERGEYVFPEMEWLVVGGFLPFKGHDFAIYPKVAGMKEVRQTGIWLRGNFSIEYDVQRLLPHIQKYFATATVKMSRKGSRTIIKPNHDLYRPKRTKFFLCYDPTDPAEVGKVTWDPHGVVGALSKQLAVYENLTRHREYMIPKGVLPSAPKRFPVEPSYAEEEGQEGT